MQTLKTQIIRAKDGRSEAPKYEIPAGTYWMLHSVSNDEHAYILVDPRPPVVRAVLLPCEVNDDGWVDRHAAHVGTEVAVLKWEQTTTVLLSDGTTILCPPARLRIVDGTDPAMVRLLILSGAKAENYGTQLVGAPRAYPR